MDERKTVLDRVRKLLRLGESSNPNEAAAALAAAQRLIDKHRLSELELAAEDVDETVVKDEEPLYEGSRVSSWRGLLARAITEANGVAAIWSRTVGMSRARIVMAGRPEDCQMVRHLFAHCVAEIDRLTLASCAGRGRAFANAFRLGCAYAIEERLRESAREVRGGASSTALVRLDDRVDRARELFGRTAKARRAQCSSGAGLVAGRVAGRRINLHRGAIDGDGEAPAALTGGSRA